MAPGGGDIVAAVAAALGGHKRTGNGWDCRCPAHDDHTASLSLSIGTTGKLVWRCHAGCSQEAVGEALKTAGLLDEPRAGRRIVAAYDYRDEAGAQLFQVVRFQPKDFRQRRPQRAGDDPAKCRDGWCWSVKGVRQVPYRLPELLAAIARGEPVFIVEGEKDADGLARLGLAATCNAGGAGKWRAAHAKALRGADAVILPDNDEPGRKHAAEVAASLAGIGRRVRILELPGLPDKGDVSDWLAAGHGGTGLMALADGAPDWHAPPALPAAPRQAEREEWRARLLTGPKGVKPLLANATLAFSEAPEWRGVLALNQLRLVVELAAPPPWAPRNGAWERRAWTENDDVRAAGWLQRAGIEVGHTIAHAAVAEAAEANPYHPVREYLGGLIWDGIERIRHFASDILGAAETPFHQAVSAAMLIAAVARAMRPGCKADNIPVLEGPQGKFKSTAIETLFGREWFTDDLAEVGTKEAALQIGRTWCAEIADLASIRRADVERIKSFASRRIDSFRAPFGRAVADHPRQSVLWGTTNETEWLKDPTGNRRFWPVACGHIDMARLRRERDQLWAEATHAWRQGEPWWLADSASVQLAREVQESRQVADAWDERIAAYVHSKDDVSVGEVLQFGLVIEPGKWGQSEQNRVARYLRSKGWSRRYVGPRGGQKWRYFAPGTEAEGQMHLDYPESGL